MGAWLLYIVFALPMGIALWANHDAEFDNEAGSFASIGAEAIQNDKYDSGFIYTLTLKTVAVEANVWLAFGVAVVWTILMGFMLVLSLAYWTIPGEAWLERCCPAWILDVFKHLNCSPVARKQQAGDAISSAMRALSRLPVFNTVAPDQAHVGVQLGDIDQSNAQNTEVQPAAAGHADAPAPPVAPPAHRARVSTLQSDRDPSVSEGQAGNVTPASVSDGAGSHSTPSLASLADAEEGRVGRPLDSDASVNDGAGVPSPPAVPP